MLLNSINYDNLKLVSIKEIPKGENVSLDKPLDIFKLCRRMESICQKSHGVGLSAVQLGIPLNICVVKNNNFFEYLVNCSYDGIGDKVNSIEGCLSILDYENKPRQFELQRFSQIQVNGFVLKFDDKSPYVNLIALEKESYSGFLSIIIQHELDHASGILISDIGQEIRVW